MLPKENIYGHTKKLNFLIEHVRNYFSLKGRPITLLDFGCGNGTAVSQYLINCGVKYYGIDIHGPSLEYAKYHFGNENVLFLDRIPEGVVFDIIIYADILEHLEDPIYVLEQHYNLLNKDGIIMGAIPNGFGPFEIEKRIDKWLGLSIAMEFAGKMKRRFLSPKFQIEEIPYNSNSGHLQFLTKKTFSSILEKSGFKMEYFKNGSFLGAPFSERLFLRGEKIAKINSKLGDFLPYWAVSTWYFTAKKWAEGITY